MTTAPGHVLQCAVILGLGFAAAQGCNRFDSDGPYAAAVNEERDVDLGKLVEGTEPKHTFRIRNSTDRPFTIISSKKSCGCQATSLTEGTVVPVGSVLEVQYALSAKRFGVQKGSLLIATDAIDDSFREIRLSLRAEIPAKIWATPSHVYLNAENVETAAQEVRVESVVPGLLGSFREVVLRHGNVTATLEQRTAEALVFRVSIAPNAPVGNTYDRVTLAFDNSKYSYLNIPVRTHRSNAVAVVPSLRLLAPTADSGILSRPEFGSTSNENNVRAVVNHGWAISNIVRGNHETPSVSTR